MNLLNRQQLLEVSLDQQLLTFAYIESQQFVFFLTISK